MGKLKKKEKPKIDENQSKISNFFQASANEVPTSKLFTQLGEHGNTSSKLSLRKSHSKSDKSKPCESTSLLCDLTSGSETWNSLKLHNTTHTSHQHTNNDKTNRFSNGEKSEMALSCKRKYDFGCPTTATLPSKNESECCVADNGRSESVQPGSFFFSTEDCGKHHMTSEQGYTKTSKLSFVGRCDGQSVSNTDEKKISNIRLTEDTVTVTDRNQYVTDTGTTMMNYVGRCDGQSPSIRKDPIVIPETQDSNRYFTSGDLKSNKKNLKDKVESKCSFISSEMKIDDTDRDISSNKLTSLKEISVKPVSKGSNSTKLSLKENHFVTPSSKGGNSSPLSSKRDHELLDSSQIIPDTPEDPLADASRKRKKVLIGRSFLTSGSAVANPAGLIIRAAVDKNQKRKITQARKSLINVSVCFNKSKTEGNVAGDMGVETDDNVDRDENRQETSELPECIDEVCDNGDQEEDDIADIMEAQACNRTSNKDIDWGISSQNDSCATNTDQNDMRDASMEFEAVSEPTVDNEAGETVNSVELEADTPTKIYNSDRLPSIKRMSKCGLSPHAKKSNFSPIELYCEGETSMHSPQIRDDVDKIKCNLSPVMKNSNTNSADRNDCLIKENIVVTDEKKTKNKMSYVGTFNYKKLETKNRQGRIKGNKIVKNEVNLEGDEILADILKELNPKSETSHSDISLPTSISEPCLNKEKTRTPQPHFLSKKSKIKSFMKGRQSDGSKSESQKRLNLQQLASSLTEEEEKYFDELDKRIHVKDFENQDYLKQEVVNNVDAAPDFEISMPVQPKFNLKDSKLSRCFSRGISKAESSAMSTVHKNKLSSSSIQKASEEISEMMKPLTENDEGGFGNFDEEMEIERCVTPDPVVKATQMIKEFKTQPDPKGVGSDCHIESFPESRELCEDFQQLSPFKKNLFEDSFSVDDNIQEKPACEKFGRHVVKNVITSENRNTVALDLQDSLDDTQRTCILHGFWTDSHVSEGDVVHVLADFDDQRVCHISDDSGLLVVNPDLLLSGTTVVSSVFCMRKSILKEKFKCHVLMSHVACIGFNVEMNCIHLLYNCLQILGCDSNSSQIMQGSDSKNSPMLYGTIIHSVFQQVLQKKITDKNQILQIAQNVLTHFLHDIYSNDVTETQVMEEVKQYIPQLQKWIQQYTHTGQTRNSKMDKTEDLVITDIKDIEENIWSPRFGIKGKIDLTVEVQIQKPRQHKLTVPLELKTGRASYSLEHKGQVTLYSMMSSDRRADPKQGLLLYLKEPSMKTITVDHLNIRGLIQLRNEMAYYISRQVQKSVEDGQTVYTLGSLPPPINNSRACSKCPQLFNCAAHHRIEKRQLSAGHALISLSETALEHVTQAHLEYFTNWCLMLDLETQTSLKHGTRNIWCQTGKERESVGECLSGLMVSGEVMDSVPELDDGLSIVKFTGHPLVDRSDSQGLDVIGLSVGDYVIISCEKPSLIAVCTGTIQHTSKNTIHLVTDSESLNRLLQIQEGYFRLDKYDGYSTGSMLYTNLSLLMGDDPHSTKLRSLIIDKATPSFLSKLSKNQIEKVKHVLKPLNKPQKMVILKVLMSKDYVLIKGYPGTGKTSTIVALIQVCRILDMSVLLTSYTHSAVDNVLVKLMQKNVSFVRLGRLNRINDKVKKFAAEFLTWKYKTVADLREFYSQQGVVATSCLGVNHPVFTQRKFDVCIVDEASQVLQPACLGPLFCAQKFVLVGDPKQLPPVVQSKEAREHGMDESLFQCLDGCGATFELNLQYRMNRDIMWLSNKLIYGGALHCGSECIADAKLMYTESADLQKLTEQYSWIGEVLRPDRVALFLNTKLVPALESRDKSGLVCNKTEAMIVRLLVQTLRAGGIALENIGIIAPYRNQVTVVKTTLKQEVEVNTVDQFQGRDKEVIIISFTRSFTLSSDTDYKSGQLLKDIRRLNVAITRAKTKLIMIGNQETLKGYSPLATILHDMETKNQIIHLPEAAHLNS